MEIFIIKDRVLYFDVSRISWIVSDATKFSNFISATSDEIIRIVEDRASDIDHLVLDFCSIRGVSNRSLELLLNHLRKKNSISTHFLNVKYVQQVLGGELERAGIFKNCKGVREEEGSYFMDDFTYQADEKKKSPDITVFKTIYKSVKFEQLSALVDECFQPWGGGAGEQLSSTPFSSDGYYDATIILRDTNVFTFVVSEMQIKLNEFLTGDQSTPKHNKPIGLLTASLRACPFATALAQINSVPLLVINHLGPFERSWSVGDSVNSINEDDLDLIFICDFVIGGTELKISRLFAQFTGNPLKKAIAIGSRKIETGSVVGIKSLIFINNDKLNLRVA